MPSGRSNASVLLNKVNSQLRGERVPIKTKEEDELAIYLQSLSQKTQQAKNVGFEEYGDISISSGADAMQTPRGRRSASPAGHAIQPSGSGSKFLKKKKPEAEPSGGSGHKKGIDSDDEENRPGKEIVIKGNKKAEPKPSILHPVRTSALDKASALANKITSRATGVTLRRHRSGDSESDDSMRGSEYGKRPGSADTSVGRDNQRFLKSRKIISDEAHEDVRSPSPQLKYQNVSAEKMDAPRKTTKTKGEIVRTLGSVYLTSEEESLAEFIHGLSTSETSKKPQNLIAKKQQKWRKKSPSPVGRQSASPIHMSRSASPFKNRSPSPFGHFSRSQSQDSDMLDSMASEIMEERYKQEDSVSSDDNKININLMDIASLIPTSPSPELGKKKGSKKSRPTSAGKRSSAASSSVFKASVPNVFKADRLTDSMTLNKKSEKPKKSSGSQSNLFESLGIQMADDLLDIDAKERKDEISASDESEILTEKSQDKQKTFKRVDSESEIETEIGSRPRKARLESKISMEDSISERLNERSSMPNIKLAYSSEEGENIETDADYSESFISESETITPSSGSKSRRRKKSKDESVRNSSRRRERKIVVEEKRVDISAADNEGKTHYWNSTQTGIRVSGPFGLQYVDPTPVASHVVSADALEALTAYSPNMLALQDMMRSQLQLITSFMDIQRRIYSSCLEGLNEDFQYTTLEDTQEYIRKNRKPQMSINEALRLVDLEDGVAR